MNNNWSSVIAPIVFEGGRSICLGTRFHPLDIHKTMFVPQKGWKQVAQEALTYDKEGILLATGLNSGLLNICKVKKN